jgi:hypothetical protein
MRFKYCIFFSFSLFFTFGCKSQASKIDQLGVYEVENGVITVTEDSNSIVYYMLDWQGDTLITSDNHFSSTHKWALHFDQSKNLWVFSSDVGDICWELDSVNNEYLKHEFWGLLSKDSIPIEVWRTLSQFYPYSNEK